MGRVQKILTKKKRFSHMIIDKKDSCRKEKILTDNYKGRFSQIKMKACKQKNW